MSNQTQTDQLSLMPVAQDPEILSISDLNKRIKNTLEGQFQMVWLKGEISNFKPHTSGHHYFSLKDANSQVSAVMFRGFNARLKFKPENGMEVVVRGRVTVYEPRGNYQIFCEIMEPVGLGALQMAFEQLKNKLKAEGLFDPARKRPIPSMPRKIAIVTSPTGAAIKDMLSVLTRRARGVDITIFPAVVQGAQAPGDLLRALDLVEKSGPYDVVIIGRGGGSIEDLWAFNDERLARAIAVCPFPTISAVGHEIDFTIADFVADLRAPTPSAAAELVVKNAADLQEKLRMIWGRLGSLINKKVQLERKQLTSVERGLVDPKRKLQDMILRVDELSDRLAGSADRHLVALRQQVEVLIHRLGSPVQMLARTQDRLSHAEKSLSQLILNGLKVRQSKLGRAVDLLQSLSPLQVVARGYSIVRKSGELVKSSQSVSTGDLLEIQLSHGTVEAQVVRIVSEKSS